MAWQNCKTYNCRCRDNVFPTIFWDKCSFVLRVCLINPMLFDIETNSRPIVFESFGLTGETAILRASGVINIIQLLASMPVIFTLDLLGRRPLLLLGSVFFLSSFFNELDRYVHCSFGSSCSLLLCRLRLAKPYFPRNSLRNFNM